MRFKLTIFFMVMMAQTFAQAPQRELADFDPKVDLISEKYEAGPYLIYDCRDQHWVCVSEAIYQECQTQREKDSKLKKVRLSCAAVARYPVKKSCFQRALYLVGKNHGTRFCINDEWKEKEIEFE